MINSLLFMYNVVELRTQEQAKMFIELAVDLYKDDKYWVRPFDNDINNVFNKDKNPCFKNGECERWLLMDGNKCVGRVAAFVNGKTCDLDSYRVGQMGFFECIDDEKAAFMLFDKCKEWLLERNMDAMEGPVNFGERIEWWGLLTNGFDKPPVYAMPYTKAYYIKFFEAYGFKDYFKQFTYRTRLAKESLSPVVVWKSDRLLKNGDYSIRTYREIGKECAIDSLLEIYNKTWNMEVHGVNGITRAQVVNIYNSLEPIIDEDLIYFAFYQNKPIGFYLMFPEINQVLKHLDGRLDLLGKLKFFYYSKVKKIDVALGQLFGVVPEFQNKGVEAAMIYCFCKTVVENNSQYKYLELNWIGDFNPPMLHLMDYLSAHVAREHTTYRCLFRDDIVFRRSVEEHHKN